MPAAHANVVPDQETPMPNHENGRDERTVEDRLLDLFQAHLTSNEKAMVGLGAKVDGMGQKIEETSNRLFVLLTRMFWLVGFAVLVLAGAAGVTTYVRLPDGTTVQAAPGATLPPVDANGGPPVAPASSDGSAGP